MVSRPKLVLIGGGEHASVVLDAALSQEGAWEVMGYVNPTKTDRMEQLQVPWLGVSLPPTSTDFWTVVAAGGVGVSGRRRDLVDQSTASTPRRWATIIHASAVVSPTAQIGAGTLVGAGAIVNPSAVIGQHCIVNTGAIVEHDVRMGDFVQVAPGTILGGGVTIGDDSFLGMGCRIRDHIAIGRGATVGMGAVVIRPVTDAETVLGVPARPRR